MALDFNVQSIRRLGLSKIMDLAQTLCRIATAATPVIKKAFPVAPKLHIMLDACSAMCALVADAQAEMDALVSDPVLVEDPTLWPGVDPFAAPWVAPE